MSIIIHERIGRTLLYPRFAMMDRSGFTEELIRRIPDSTSSSFNVEMNEGAPTTGIEIYRGSDVLQGHVDKV